MRVGVIFGGRSAEHEISILSARYIVSVLDPARYEVTLMGVDRWGRWWFEEVAAAMLREGPEVISPPEKPPDPAALLPPVERLAGVDIVIPVLHGPFGEDGTIQGMLEVANIPYVGCGVTASAVAMDKAVANDLFQAHELPVAPYLVAGRWEWERRPKAVVARVESTLTYPLFVKPANLGSSVGVTKVRNSGELPAALTLAARYDSKVIVQKAIDAREIEVSVLGNEEPEASVPGEVVPSREWYSYEAKYLDDASELLIPAPLTPTQTTLVQEMALTAFKCIGGSGLARVDFLLDRRSGAVYINEVNTFPGFTPMSMYPKLWEASGIPGPDLVDRLIALGMERHADRQRNAVI